MKIKNKDKIPEGWEKRKINQIFKIETGTTPSTKIKTYWKDGTINWVTPADMSKIKNNFIEESNRKISKMGLEKTNLTLMPKNSIIISTRAPVGYVFMNKKEITFNQGCKGLIPLVEREIEPLFFVYLLRSMKERLQNISGGSTFKELSKTQLENFEVLFPSSSKEQKAIVKTLSVVDQSIENTEEIITKIEKIKKGIMNEMLIKGINHKKFKEVKIGRKDYNVPEEWDVKNLSSTSTLKARIGWQGLTRREYKKEGDYYLVTGTDFEEDRIKWGNCYYVDKERYDQDENIQLKEEDILITKDGSIGKIAFVENLPGKATLNSGIFVVRPLDKEYTPKFIYYVMKSQFFDSFMNVIAGSTIAHLYQRDFINFEFPLPSLPEQQKIVEILSTIDMRLELEQKRKQKLIKIKKGLMNDLLTGNKKVNDNKILEIGK